MPGGERVDILKAENFTPGEQHVITYVINDLLGVPVVNFTDWEMKWFLLDRLTRYNGLVALAANALVIKTELDGIDLDTVPNAVVSLEPEDTEDLFVAVYAYELWRTDLGNESRKAYGTIAFVA